MQKLYGIAYLIAALLLLSVHHPEINAQDSSQVFLFESIHTFGTVIQGKTITHTFAIRNTSAVPLKIARMELSQLGMTARVTPVILPAQEGKVTVNWDTHRVNGDLTGEVAVYFDEPAQPPMLFLLRGVINPPLEVLPSRAVFVSLFKGESAERTITIVNNEVQPIAITRLDARNQRFVADIHTVESGKVYQIRVKVPPETPPGRYREALEVYTDDPKRGPIKIGVNVLVKENLYTFPDTVDFGTISLGELARTRSIPNLTQTVLVKKREGEFEINSVASTLPFLRIHRVPAGRSNTFRIDVSLDHNELLPGKVNGSLRIRTTDTEFPELEIPVRGELR
jgi:Protein of unknown function (DUF1573)